MKQLGYYFKTGAIKSIIVLIFTISGYIISFAEIDSSGIEQKIVSAEKYFLERKLDSAEKYYSYVLDEDSNNLKARLGLIKIILLQDEFETKLKKKSPIQDMRLQARGIVTSNDFAKYYKAYEKLKDIKKHDFNNIEIDYLYGIVNKDMQKLKISSDIKRSYNTAKSSFENVLLKDSSYCDVLLQYGLLSCNNQEYKKSIDLVRKYIVLKPYEADGYLCLNRIANIMFLENGYKESKDSISVTDDINKYCRAVLLRRSEKIKEAKYKLYSIIDNGRDTILPNTLLYKEILKCEAAVNDKEQFMSIYNKLMETLSSDRNCDILFDDLKYLSLSEELSEYYSIDYNLKNSRWFPSFWAKRTSGGLQKMDRIFEHYKRLLYAEKYYAQDRECHNFMKPLQSYNSNMEFTDQGYIYIKYGEPDKKQGTRDLFLGEDLENNPDSDGGSSPDSMVHNIRESWLYKPNALGDKKIFHFFGFAKNLVDVIYDDVYMKSIRDWDQRFSDLQASKKFGVEPDITLKTDLGISMKEELLTNLKQERSEVNLSYKNIELNYQIYRFRENNNKTRILLGYFIPSPTIFLEMPGNQSEIPVMSGYNFYDSDWNLIAEKNDSIILSKKADGIIPKTKFLSFRAKSGKIFSDIFCNPIGTGISCFNKDTMNVQGFSKSELCASDVMLSITDNEAKGAGIKWNQSYLLPSPTKKRSLKTPVNLYYEIYNLAKNREGKTLFRIEYAFRYKGNNENMISKIFSKSNNEVVSAEYSQSGKEGESHQCMSFEVDRLSPGDYTVEIIVNDINSGKSITLSKDIQLF